MAANGKADKVAALHDDPAIAKGLQEDTVLYCGMRGRTIDDFRSAKTMTAVIYDARAPHHAGACGACHHESEESRANCAACHGEDNKGNVPRLKDAFHARCTGCHRETRVASLGCYDCHLPRLVARVSGVPDRLTIMEIQKTKRPVFFDHKSHITRAKRGCRACHHKEERGGEQKCSGCHWRLTAQGKKVALKDAFHKACKGCHDRLMVGPTKCDGCHPKR